MSLSAFSGGHQIRTAVGAIVGTAGVWTNVTPAGIVLAGSDVFGVQDILADPAVSGRFYAFTCYDGMWRSVDYGQTWVKHSTGGGPLDFGKNWGESMAPDGSYMLATSGNNGSGSPEYKRTVLKSTDGGVVWTASGDLGADPYNVAISPFDKTRAVTVFHDTNQFSESVDSGATWSTRQAVGSTDLSNYVHYLHNSDTVIVVGQNQSGCYRGTKSGGVWTFNSIASLATVDHSHGVHQMFHDVTNSAFFLPGFGGIFKSTDNGVSWSNVYSAFGEDVVIGTTQTLYGARSAPFSSGTFAPKITTAPRNPGTTWATAQDPAGMDNGPKGAAVGSDGVRSVVVFGNWVAGIWRYIEAAP